MCARLFRDAARPLPQAGQTKPSGQRRSNRNAAQLVSSGKLAWNSLRDRALATGRPLAPAACGWPRGCYTSYGAPWDSGISLIVYAPTSVYQSLAAGIGWTGAMNILLTSSNPESERSQAAAVPITTTETSGTVQ